ncbi:MAG: hypothetical protein V4580_01385 [Bacteroidota bacterium]
MSSTSNITKFISIKGLKTYIAFLAIILSAFLYIQLNGIMLYSSTQTEHEGNNHAYGSSHHK